MVKFKWKTLIIKNGRDKEEKTGWNSIAYREII